MISKPLPDNPPVGMLEAMDDNSISISDEESVSEMSSVQDQDFNKPPSKEKIEIEDASNIVLEDTPKCDPVEEAPKVKVEETKEPNISITTLQETESKQAEDNNIAMQKFANHVGKMQEIKEQDEDDEPSSENSPSAKDHNKVDDSEAHSKEHSDEESKNDNEDSESEEEKEHHIEEDTEFDRANAILLDKPFYSVEEEENPLLLETASFGEQEGKELLKWMPSFAKFGFNNNLKNKLGKENTEVKVPKPPAHEVGPEYLSIDSSNNLQSGFFYLAREEEKLRFEKKSKRKKTIVIDLPGVLVAFADAKQGGIFSAHWIEFSNIDEEGPKQFVYLWERDELHWFLGKLRGTHEIILWSSLSRELTDRVVAHIQRESNYFAYVLCKENCLSFNERKPTNLVLANATLMMGNKSDQKKWLDMSFSNISKALYPIGILKDLTLLLKSREFDSIFVVDCTENALAYMSKSSCIRLEKFVRAVENKGFFDPIQQESVNDRQSDSDSEKDSSDSDDSDSDSENEEKLEYESLKDLFKTVKSKFS